MGVCVCFKSKIQNLTFSSRFFLQVLINGLQHLAPPRLRSNLQIVETYIKVPSTLLVFGDCYC